MRDGFCHGQMTVELAVLMPVIIVVGLIVYNLVRFLCLCASFDRLATDAVISQGVAPSGDQNQATAVTEVRSCLEQALDDPACSVDVRVEGIQEIGSATGEISFPLSPLLTRFVCTLSFHPWPTSLSIAGVSYGPIAELTHEKVLVVDRYRPGVVV